MPVGDGFTQLEVVVDQRRCRRIRTCGVSEAYLYFNVAADQRRCFTLWGRGMRRVSGDREQADGDIAELVSIHSGAGTSNYMFCWGMGGENQAFDDMDHFAGDGSEIRARTV